MTAQSDAIAWAGAALDDPVADAAELPGGMTSAMLALTHTSGRATVLRLMTNEPWRTHGAALTARERDAFAALDGTGVPAPRSLALDADGSATGVAAHLMTRLPGTPAETLDHQALTQMAQMLHRIHAVRPAEPFRQFQSWAWEAKWVVPAWSRHPDVWQRAFEILASQPPAFEPTFLHRDFSHRNLLWQGSEISGVVDWVETSKGPAWLDAGHAATNLAVAHGQEAAEAFVAAYADASHTAPATHWMVMDVVGFLPPPGRKAMFDSPLQRERLDAWLAHVVAAHDRP